MKASVFLLLTFFLFQSCSKNDIDDETIYGPFTGNDVSFLFSIVNPDNEDLLDQNKQGTLNTDQIRVYNILDGRKVLNSSNDHPHGYFIGLQDGVNMIGFRFNLSNLEAQSIIKWNEHDQDTLSFEMEQSDFTKKLIAIKFNQQIVWDEKTTINPGDLRYFQIVK